MNKERQLSRKENLPFEEKHKGPLYFPSQNSFENSVMTGLVSGQSMPNVKTSENEIKTRILVNDWNYKSKSEPRINEDYDF